MHYNVWVQSFNDCRRDPVSQKLHPHATKLQLQICFVGNVITGWIIFLCNSTFVTGNVVTRKGGGWGGGQGYKVHSYDTRDSTLTRMVVNNNVSEVTLHFFY